MSIESRPRVGYAERFVSSTVTTCYTAENGPQRPAAATAGSSASAATGCAAGHPSSQHPLSLRLYRAARACCLVSESQERLFHRRTLYRAGARGKCKGRRSSSAQEVRLAAAASGWRLISGHWQVGQVPIGIEGGASDGRANVRGLPMLPTGLQSAGSAVPGRAGSHDEGRGGNCSGFARRYAWEPASSMLL